MLASAALPVDNHSADHVVGENARAALETADHGYVLEAGRVALEGDKQTLRADDRVRRAYLGM